MEVPDLAGDDTEDPVTIETTPPEAAPAEPQAAQNAQEASGSSELEALQGRLAAAEAEIAQWKDQALRKAADFDNYRKRMQREKDESLRYANAGLLEDLLPVLDDFERALKSSESARDFDGLHQGIAMIEGQLVALLESKYGLSRTPGSGTVFDPNFHEAIASLPVPEGADPVILEEYQRGYRLHDRVLRAAKVRVGPLETSTNESKGE